MGNTGSRAVVRSVDVPLHILAIVESDLFTKRIALRDPLANKQLLDFCTAQRASAANAGSSLASAATAPTDANVVRIRIDENGLAVVFELSMLYIVELPRRQSAERPHEAELKKLLTDTLLFSSLRMVGNTVAFSLSEFTVDKDKGKGKVKRKQIVFDPRVLVLFDTASGKSRMEFPYASLTCKHEKNVLTFSDAASRKTSMVLVADTDLEATTIAHIFQCCANWAADLTVGEGEFRDSASRVQAASLTYELETFASHEQNARADVASTTAGGTGLPADGSAPLPPGVTNDKVEPAVTISEREMGVRLHRAAALVKYGLYFAAFDDVCIALSFPEVPSSKKSHALDLRSTAAFRLCEHLFDVDSIAPLLLIFIQIALADATASHKKDGFRIDESTKAALLAKARQEYCTLVDGVPAEPESTSEIVPYFASEDVRHSLFLSKYKRMKRKNFKTVQQMIKKGAFPPSTPEQLSEAHEDAERDQFDDDGSEGVPSSPRSVAQTPRSPADTPRSGTGASSTSTPRASGSASSKAQNASKSPAPSADHAGLESLDFTMHAIIDLRTSGILAFAKLRVLNLSCNRIKVLDFNDIVELPMLQKLVVAHNEIAKVVGMLPRESSLSSIDLSFNKLGSIGGIIKGLSLVATKIHDVCFAGNPFWSAFKESSALYDFLIEYRFSLFSRHFTNLRSIDGVVITKGERLLSDILFGQVPLLRRILGRLLPVDPTSSAPCEDVLQSVILSFSEAHVAMELMQLIPLSLHTSIISADSVQSQRCVAVMRQLYYSNRRTQQYLMAMSSQWYGLAALEKLLLSIGKDALVSEGAASLFDLFVSVLFPKERSSSLLKIAWDGFESLFAALAVFLGTVNPQGNWVHLYLLFGRFVRSAKANVVVAWWSRLSDSVRESFIANMTSALISTKEPNLVGIHELASLCLGLLSVVPGCQNLLQVHLSSAPVVRLLVGFLTRSKECLALSSFLCKTEASSFIPFVTADMLPALISQGSDAALLVGAYFRYTSLDDALSGEWVSSVDLLHKLIDFSSSDQSLKSVVVQAALRCTSGSSATLLVFLASCLPDSIDALTAHIAQSSALTSEALEVMFKHIRNMAFDEKLMHLLQAIVDGAKKEQLLASCLPDVVLDFALVDHCDRTLSLLAALVPDQPVPADDRMHVVLERALRSSLATSDSVLLLLDKYTFSADRILPLMLDLPIGPRMLAIVVALLQRSSGIDSRLYLLALRAARNKEVSMFAAEMIISLLAREEENGTRLVQCSREHLAESELVVVLQNLCPVFRKKASVSGMLFCLSLQNDSVATFAPTVMLLGANPEVDLKFVAAMHKRRDDQMPTWRATRSVWVPVISTVLQKDNDGLVQYALEFLQSYIFSNGDEDLELDKRKVLRDALLWLLTSSALASRSARLKELALQLVFHPTLFDNETVIPTLAVGEAIDADLLTYLAKRPHFCSSEIAVLDAYLSPAIISGGSCEKLVTVASMVVQCAPNDFPLQVCEARNLPQIIGSSAPLAAAIAVQRPIHKDAIFSSLCSERSFAALSILVQAYPSTVSNAADVVVGRLYDSVVSCLMDAPSEAAWSLLEMFLSFDVWVNATLKTQLYESILNRPDICRRSAALRILGSAEGSRDLAIRITKSLHESAMFQLANLLTIARSVIVSNMCSSNVLSAVREALNFAFRTDCGVFVAPMPVVRIAVSIADLKVLVLEDGCLSQALRAMLALRGDAGLLPELMVLLKLTSRISAPYDIFYEALTDENENVSRGALTLLLSQKATAVESHVPAVQIAAQLLLASSSKIDLCSILEIAAEVVSRDTFLPVVLAVFSSDHLVPLLRIANGAALSVLKSWLIGAFAAGHIVKVSFDALSLLTSITDVALHEAIARHVTDSSLDKTVATFLPSVQNCSTDIRRVWLLCRAQLQFFSGISASDVDLLLTIPFDDKITSACLRMVRLSPRHLPLLIHAGLVPALLTAGHWRSLSILPDDFGQLWLTLADSVPAHMIDVVVQYGFLLAMLGPDDLFCHSVSKWIKIVNVHHVSPSTRFALLKRCARSLCDSPASRVDIWQFVGALCRPPIDPRRVSEQDDSLGDFSEFPAMTDRDSLALSLSPLKKSASDEPLHSLVYDEMEETKQLMIILDSALRAIKCEEDFAAACNVLIHVLQWRSSAEMVQLVMSSTSDFWAQIGLDRFEDAQGDSARTSIVSCDDDGTRRLSAKLSVESDSISVDLGEACEQQNHSYNPADSSRDLVDEKFSSLLSLYIALATLEPAKILEFLLSDDVLESLSASRQLSLLVALDNVLSSGTADDHLSRLMGRMGIGKVVKLVSHSQTSFVKSVLSVSLKAIASVRKSVDADADLGDDYKNVLGFACTLFPDEQAYELASHAVRLDSSAAAYFLTTYQSAWETCWATQSAQSWMLISQTLCAHPSSLSEERQGRLLGAILSPQTHLVRKACLRVVVMMMHEDMFSKKVLVEVITSSKWLSFLKNMDADGITILELLVACIRDERLALRDLVMQSLVASEFAPVLTRALTDMGSTIGHGQSFLIDDISYCLEIVRAMLDDPRRTIMLSERLLVQFLFALKALLRPDILQLSVQATVLSLLHRILGDVADGFYAPSLLTSLGSFIASDEISVVRVSVNCLSLLCSKTKAHLRDLPSLKLNPVALVQRHNILPSDELWTTLFNLSAISPSNPSNIVACLLDAYLDDYYSQTGASVQWLTLVLQLLDRFGDQVHIDIPDERVHILYERPAALPLLSRLAVLPADALFAESLANDILSGHAEDYQSRVAVFFRVCSDNHLLQRVSWYLLSKDGCDNKSIEEALRYLSEHVEDAEKYVHALTRLAQAIEARNRSLLLHVLCRFCNAAGFEIVEQNVIGQLWRFAVRAMEALTMDAFADCMQTLALSRQAAFDGPDADERIMFILSQVPFAYCPLEQTAIVRNALLLLKSVPKDTVLRILLDKPESRDGFCKLSDGNPELFVRILLQPPVDALLSIPAFFKLLLANFAHFPASEWPSMLSSIHSFVVEHPTLLSLAEEGGFDYSGLVNTACELWLNSQCDIQYLVTFAQYGHLLDVMVAKSDRLVDLLLMRVIDRSADCLPALLLLRRLCLHSAAFVASAENSDTMTILSGVLGVSDDEELRKTVFQTMLAVGMCFKHPASVVDAMLQYCEDVQTEIDLLRGNHVSNMAVESSPMAPQTSHSPQTQGGYSSVQPSAPSSSPPSGTKNFSSPSAPPIQQQPATPVENRKMAVPPLPLFGLSVNSMRMESADSLKSSESSPSANVGNVDGRLDDVISEPSISAPVSEREAVM